MSSQTSSPSRFRRPPRAIVAALLLAAAACAPEKQPDKAADPPKPAAAAAKPTKKNKPAETAKADATKPADPAHPAPSPKSKPVAARKQAETATSQATPPESTPDVQVPPLTPHVDGGKPSYEVVPTHFDLGVLQPNERHDYEVVLWNRSDRPFSIAFVKTECKCLAYEYDHGMIEPGKSTKIAVRITATSGGARTTAFTLHLSDPARSKVRVPFDYVIVPPILLEPKIVDLGRIEAGQTAEQEVRLTLHLPDQLKEDPVVEPFVAHDVPVEMKLDPPTVSPSRHGIRDWVAKLHVKLHSAKAVPSFSTYLVVQPKDPKAFRGTQIPLHGEVITSFYWERQSLGFGSVTAATPESRDLKYFFPSGATPKIVELSCDLPEFTATATPDLEHHCFVVTVTCLATKAGNLNGKVKMVTSLAPEEPDFLKVSARAR